MQALNYIMMLLGYAALIGAIASYILYTSDYSNFGGRLIVSFLGFGFGRMKIDLCESTIDLFESNGHKLYKTKEYAFILFAPWRKL